MIASQLSARDDSESCISFQTRWGFLNAKALFFVNGVLFFFFVRVLSNISSVFPRLQVLEQVGRYVHVSSQNSKHRTFLLIMIARLLLLSEQRLAQSQDDGKAGLPGVQISLVNKHLPLPFPAAFILRQERERWGSWGRAGDMRRERSLPPRNLVEAIPQQTVKNSSTIVKRPSPFLAPSQL